MVCEFPLKKWIERLQVRCVPLALYVVRLDNFFLKVALKVRVLVLPDPHLILKMFPATVPAEMARPL